LHKEITSITLNLKEAFASFFISTYQNISELSSIVTPLFHGETFGAFFSKPLVCEIDEKYVAELTFVKRNKTFADFSILLSALKYYSDFFKQKEYNDDIFVLVNYYKIIWTLLDFIDFYNGCIYRYDLFEKEKLKHLQTEDQVI